MTISMRRLFRTKKDPELVQAAVEAAVIRAKIDLCYEDDIPVTEEFASKASEDILVGSVATAVARERTAHGGHKGLCGDLRIDPKRKSRLFGKMLRFKRGIESD